MADGQQPPQEKVPDFKSIPADDIVYHYGPASEMKRMAVSHLLSDCTEYLVIADNPAEQPATDVSHVWIIGEVPPLHTVTFVGMIAEKYTQLYGVSWLSALLHGMLAHMADKQAVLAILKTMEKELEGG